jgi:CubicO group peptidase (beta-lactamase class C family)
MPAPRFFTVTAADVGLNPDRVAALVDRAAQDVRDGLLPSVQVAIARHGRIAAMRTFGDALYGGRRSPASNDTLYAVFSVTKGITSAAAWLLVEDGTLDPAARVADLLPEFGTHGKEAVLVEHLFTHTAGFPYAPFAPADWLDPERRRERFRQWRLNWEPGTRFEYHPTASMWVVAALIERCSGQPFTEFVRRRVAEPLDLFDLRLGCPPAYQHRIADVIFVGDPATPEELAALGIVLPPTAEAMQEGYLSLNRPEVREIPIPGGGAFSTAGDVALFYQALLAGGCAHDGRRVWQAETIQRALQVRSGTLTDPFFHTLANRALGMIIAGDETRVFRGFGPSCSPEAFGHNGAGGQIAWADPRSGVSFAYCTNGFDRNPIRQAQRTVTLSSLAAECAPGP